MKKRRWSTNAYLSDTTDPVLNIDELKLIFLQWLKRKLLVAFSFLVHCFFLCKKHTSKVNLFVGISAIKSYLTNDFYRKQLLKEWIESKVDIKKPIIDLTEACGDGILLCALMESIVPGSCPRFDLLDPQNAINNIKLFLKLLQQHLNVITEMKAEDIVSGCCQHQLLCLLSSMKLAASKLVLKSILRRSPSKSVEKKKTHFDHNVDEEKKSYAKGMGLILAVRGREARFNIHFQSNAVLDLIIEIEGPIRSFCRERVTNKVMNRKSCGDRDEFRRADDSCEFEKIAFYSEQVANNILQVSYFPVEIGKHKLSIISCGQYVMGSPFAVTVDDSVELRTLHPQLNKSFVNITKHSGVIRKRIIKQTMIINGEEVPMNTKETFFRESGTHSKVENAKRKPLLPMLRVNSNPPVEDVTFTQDDNGLIVGQEMDELHFRENYASFTHSESDIDGNVSNPAENEIPKDLETSLPRKRKVESDEYFDCDSNDKLSLNSFENIQPEFVDSDEVFPLKRRSTLDDLLNGEDPYNEEVNSEFQKLAKEVEEVPFDCYMIHTSSYPVRNLVKQWENDLESLNSTMQKNTTPVKKNPADKTIYTSVKTRRTMFEEKTKRGSNGQQDMKSARREILKGFNVKERKQFWESLNRENNSKAMISESPNSVAAKGNSSSSSEPSQADSGISGEAIAVNYTSHRNTRSKQNFKDTKCRSYSYPCLRKMKEKMSRSRSFDQNSTDLIAQRRWSAKSLTSSVNGFIDDEMSFFVSLLDENNRLTNSEVTLSRETFEDKLSRRQSEESGNHFADKGIYPEKCFAFGDGISHGKVGVKNRFTVCTKYGGRSFLSVGIQGIEEDDVRYIYIKHISDHNYEVVYEVTRAGYFIVFVRFGDWNIANGPFITRITF